MEEGNRQSEKRFMLKSGASRCGWRRCRKVRCLATPVTGRFEQRAVWSVQQAFCEHSRSRANTIPPVTFWPPLARHVADSDNLACCAASNSLFNPSARPTKKRRRCHATTGAAMRPAMPQGHSNSMRSRIRVWPAPIAWNSCVCFIRLNGPRVCSSTKRNGGSKRIIRAVKQKRTPKCRARNVTHLPSPIRPLIRPATARSFVFRAR